MSSRDNAMDEILAGIAKEDEARAMGRVLTGDEWDTVYQVMAAGIRRRGQVSHPDLEETLITALAKIRIFTPPPMSEEGDPEEYPAGQCHAMGLMVLPPGEEEGIDDRSLGAWVQCTDDAGHSPDGKNHDAAGEWAWDDTAPFSISHEDAKNQAAVK